MVLIRTEFCCWPPGRLSICSLSISVEAIGPRESKDRVLAVSGSLPLHPPEYVVNLIVATIFSGRISHNDAGGQRSWVALTSGWPRSASTRQLLDWLGGGRNPHLPSSEAPFLVMARRWHEICGLGWPHGY